MEVSILVELKKARDVMIKEGVISTPQELVEQLLKENRMIMEMGGLRREGDLEE